MPYSNWVKPVTLPPGCARLRRSRRRPDRRRSRTQWAWCGSPVATAPRWGATGHDDVGRERDQLRRISANAVGIAVRPADSRSARCGRRSSPIPAAPAGTPRRGPVLPDRPRRGSRARRCARTFSRCCARAASGHTPPRRRASVMNSRRRHLPASEAQAERCTGSHLADCEAADVRFGSKAT